MSEGLLRFPVNKADFAARSRVAQATGPAAPSAPAPAKSATQAAPKAPRPVTAPVVAPQAAPAKTAAVAPKVAATKPKTKKLRIVVKPQAQTAAAAKPAARKAGRTLGSHLRRAAAGFIAFAGALTMSFNFKAAPENPAPDTGAKLDTADTQAKATAQPDAELVKEARYGPLPLISKEKTTSLFTVGVPSYASVDPAALQSRIDLAFAPSRNEFLQHAFFTMPLTVADVEAEKPARKATPLRKAKAEMAKLVEEAPMAVAYSAYAPERRAGSLIDVFENLLAKPVQPLMANNICQVLKPHEAVAKAAVLSLPKAERAQFQRIDSANWGSLCNAVIANHRKTEPDFPVSKNDASFEATARFTNAVLDVNPRAFDFLLSGRARNRYLDFAHIKPSNRKLRVIDFGHGVKLPGGAYDGGAVSHEGKDETDYLKIVGPRILPSLLADSSYDTVATRKPDEMIHPGPLTKANDLHKRKMILMATGLLSGHDQRAMISFHLDSAEGRPTTPFGVNIFSNPRSSLSGTFAAALRERLFARTQMLTQSAESKRVMRADGEHIVVVELANINSPRDLSRMLAPEFAPNMLAAVSGVSAEKWAKSPTLVATRDEPQRVVRASAKRPART